MAKDFPIRIHDMRSPVVCVHCNNWMRIVGCLAVQDRTVRTVG